MKQEEQKIEREKGLTDYVIKGNVKKEDLKTN